MSRDLIVPTILAGLFIAASLWVSHLQRQAAKVKPLQQTVALQDFSAVTGRITSTEAAQAHMLTMREWTDDQRVFDGARAAVAAGGDDERELERVWAQADQAFADFRCADDGLRGAQCDDAAAGKAAGPAAR